ncbi:MAG: hypothetical protein QOF41_2807 [Methylobacteriaceae bacterium]|jgi:hypothetical protein|nr:hypothetical protein [Methylobacteriaceae bacterium]
MRRSSTIGFTALIAMSVAPALPAAAQYYYGEPPPLVVGPPVPYYQYYYPPASAEPRPYYRATGQPDPWLSGTRGRMNQGASPNYPEGPGNPRVR